ncbi:MAG: hypothetical protein ACREIQ_07815 [Nitrospiria bacterium]
MVRSIQIQMGFMPLDSNGGKWPIFLFVFTFIGLSIHACSLHRPYTGENSDTFHAIAIRDDILSPNLSITPPEMIIKAGEVVAWANYTSSVLQLSLQGIEGQEKPGLLKRLGSKAGLLSKDKVNANTLMVEPAERLRVLEETLKEQRLQLEQMKAQLNSAQEPQQSLQERFQTLEERLKEQEVQLAELKMGALAPTEPPKTPQIPAFINPFTTIKGKFEFPGRYAFTLYQSSPNRRPSHVQGSITVLPVAELP